MRQLVDGVRAYQRQEFPTMRNHMRRLADYQKPRALFFTCSDSRVEPTRFTSSLPGELLVVRNAGNIIPSSEDQCGAVATIEYAVKRLNVPEIVVCGHSHCDAMRAVVHPDEVESLPAVNKWLRSELSELAEQAAACDSLWDVAVANVRLQLKRLRALPVVREAEAAGDLKVQGWCYRFETGDVFDVEKVMLESVVKSPQLS